jgi:hypothetical protein
MKQLASDEVKVRIWKTDGMGELRVWMIGDTSGPCGINIAEVQ